MQVFAKLVLQPTAKNSLCFSFLFHTSMILVFALVAAQRTDRFALAGNRRAIWLEVSGNPAESAKKMVHVLEIEVEANRAIDSTVSQSPDEADQPEPRAIAAEKESVRNDDIWVASQLPPTAMEEIAPSHNMTKTSLSDRLVEPAIDPKSHVPLRRSTVDRPLSMASVRQMAGFDDRVPPDLSANQPPAYPPEAIRRGWEGTVILRLTVTSDGRVVAVEVWETSGHRLLDDAAISTVRNWHGRPAEFAGVPVATEEFLPIRFRLRDEQH